MKTALYLVAFLGLTAGARGAEEIAWAKDWASAQSEAKRSNKLLMVDFYTSWCGWCKKLDKDTYADPKVVKLASNLVSVKIDAEEKKVGVGLAKKYEVQGFPTILFLDPSGEVVGRIGGYAAPTEFIGQVTRFQTSFEEFPKLQAAAKARPHDGEANAQYAAVLAQRGKAQEAQEHLHKAEKARYKGDALYRAYNSVGDVHQSGGRIDEAIEAFRKADADAAPVEVQSYARINLAQCYASKQDLRAARKEAKRVLELKGAPEEHQQAVRGFLERTKGEKDGG